ncbi:lipase family protein [Streptomyces vilmorinianum]|uniref:lipase family protein n=1 Tax=Streptomyces vilmorinianum TaxID=3051092 RepID=UPI0010FBB231|nr:lipase family protein [Streptomyces vilmorinianum]
MSPATPAPKSGGAALELLVHGVGGATPQDMLGDPRTVRVTGDTTAAVYRRTDDVDAEDHPERYAERPVPEAYCWSNLTSGNGARALWLLLLPFMVANLAHWMRPPAKGRPSLLRLYGVLVRLVALTLTVLLTAAACEVALDLTAWQCAGSAACAEDRSWLGFLSAERGGWWSQPGRRLALAAVVPAALVGLLWYLSNRTWSAYEAQRPPTGYDDAPAEASDTENPDTEASDTENPDTESADSEELCEPGEPRPALGRPGFWYGRRLVARLRAAHTAAGFLTVAAAVTGAAARHDRDAPGAPPEAFGWALESGFVVLAAVVLWVVCRRGRSEKRLDLRLERALVSWLPGASLVLLALAVLHAGWSRPDWRSTGTLPGDAAFGVLTLAQGGLVVALGAVALLLHRPHRDPRTALYGLGGPAVAMLACALGGVMSGGVAQRVADWLDGPGTPGMGAGSPVAPPVLLSWQASVIPVLLLMLLAPAVFLAVRTARAARRLGPVVEAEYGTDDPDPVRTGRIAAGRATAELTDAAPALVGIVSGATLLLGAGAVAGAWLSGNVPGRAFDGAHPAVASAAATAQSLGSWMIGFGFLLFVTWGRRAYKDASARRTIGILWDVGTFWPRAAHPFAPPCYAERAVPDLTWRMSSWTRHTGGRLVISGHSQGSVLAAAAVWQLPPPTRRRVALLTYGSPLERLYGRWFPAYFGPGPLRALYGTVHCWSNLHRATDPIGGPVRVPAEGDKPAVDRAVLLDPLVYGRTPAHPLPEPVLGHSDYQADPAFAAERSVLLDRLPPALPRQRVGATDDQADQADQGSSGRSSG